MFFFLANSSTFYERYGLGYYLNEALGGAAAIPGTARLLARVGIRKVMYGRVWQKNKAVLALPVVGDETYSSVMTELFDICEDEYGFEHKDERVCKAMFKRTEDKHVDNVEHFAVLMVLFVLPVLMLTPKAKRTTSFFILLPIVFIAAFVMIP